MTVSLLALDPVDTDAGHRIVRAVVAMELDDGEHPVWRIRCQDCRRTRVGGFAGGVVPAVPAVDFLTLTAAQKLHTCACGGVHLTDA